MLLTNKLTMTCWLSLFSLALATTSLPTSLAAGPGALAKAASKATKRGNASATARSRNGQAAAAAPRPGTRAPQRAGGRQEQRLAAQQRGARTQPGRTVGQTHGHPAKTVPSGNTAAAAIRQRRAAETPAQAARANGAATRGAPIARAGAGVRSGTSAAGQRTTAASATGARPNSRPGGISAQPGSRAPVRLANGRSAVASSNYSARSTPRPSGYGAQNNMLRKPAVRSAPAPREAQRRDGAAESEARPAPPPR